MPGPLWATPPIAALLSQWYNLRADARPNNADFPPGALNDAAPQCFERPARYGSQDFVAVCVGRLWRRILTRAPTCLSVGSGAFTCCIIIWVILRCNRFGEDVGVQPLHQLFHCRRQRLLADRERVPKARQRSFNFPPIKRSRSARNFAN